MKAPKTYEGKALRFEEYFRSTPKETRAEAEWKLSQVRDSYPLEGGWVEIEAWIEPVSTGYVAVRHHAKYE